MDVKIINSDYDEINDPRYVFLCINIHKDDLYCVQWIVYDTEDKIPLYIYRERDNDNEEVNNFTGDAIYVSDGRYVYTAYPYFNDPYIDRYYINKNDEECLREFDKLVKSGDIDLEKMIIDYMI